MVVLSYKTDEFEDDKYFKEDLPESALAVKAKYEADVGYLRDLIAEAVDFILEGIDGAEQLRDQFEKDDISADSVRLTLEDKAAEEYDPEVRCIFEEAATKVRFLADYFKFQMDKGLEGKIRNFVYEKKQTYKKPSFVNKLVLEMFGCQFETLTNTITKPRKKLNLSDEESELWARVRRGDVEAIHRIVVENQGLIKKIMIQLYGEYSKSHDFNDQDLFNEGVLGLQKAVTRYNPALGNRFSTVAYYWIWSYVSAYIYKRLKHLSPGRGMLHLDAPINNDRTKNFHSVIGAESPDYDRVDDMEFREKLLAAIKDHFYSAKFARVGKQSLSPDLAYYIVVKYFFDENSLSHKEIAETWPLCARTGKPYSHQRIAQFKVRILESFKKNPEIMKLLEEARKNL